MQAGKRIAVALFLTLSGCGGANEPAAGPAQSPKAGPERQAPAAAAPKDPPCRGMPVAVKQLPAAVYRTNDVPKDQWPRDYGLPLVITVRTPRVPDEIRRPSPPIIEEPER